MSPVVPTPRRSSTPSRSNRFRTIFGVDFSGAKLAGRNIWIARCRAGRGKTSPLVLEDLSSLESLAGAAERERALAHLVDLIGASEDALWSIDCPFGMPVEVLDDGFTWPDQLRLVERWRGGAYAFGLWCLGRAKRLGGAMHIRRTTDVDTKAPFDCYHYRMIYQSFHGMRDVVAPLARRRGTAVAPFQFRRLPTARRVLVETCPSSTLKRLGLPHHNYKQPAGGPLTARRRRTRGVILEGLSGFIEIDPAARRRIMRNPGGDALDAVIAAVGGRAGWLAADPRALAAHHRYPLEGHIYA